MPLSRGVDILEQMCAALARAHDLGVVHRDLKSDNILLTTRGGRKDFVKILDFGLAHLAMDPRLAPKGAVFGTPEYMAPEQARGEEATAQSDLYALGVLFFEMLTGQLPFRSDDRETLLEMQRTAVAPRPRSIKPDVLPAAEAIVVKLLEKDRRKRFQDAHHLHEELKALQRSLPSTPWEVAATGDNAAPPPPPPPQSPGRHRVGEPRRALLAHGLARLPAGQRAARRAERDVAGVGPGRRARRASRARWRATRASSRRSSGAAARSARRSAARSRSSRTRSRARCAMLSAEQAEVARLKEALLQAERGGGAGQAGGRRGEPRGSPQLRAVFERAGAAMALVEAQARAAQGARAEGRREGRAGARPAPADRGAPRAARPLRRGARGGPRRAAARRSPRARARGSRYEKAFSEVSTLLLNHLKAKPEARDLLQELIAAMHGQSYNGPKTESRTPG